LKEVKATVILLEISTGSLPGYKHNMPYSATIESNAVQPKYTIVNGSLPAGLTLSLDGIISGTVTPSVGYSDYTFTVKVTDENNCVATKAYALSSCGQAPTLLNAAVQYCNDASSVPLDALVSAQLPLKWYNDRRQETSSTPSTAEVGKHIYYVTMLNDVLQCESDTASIEVTVTALPELIFDAPDINVCYGYAPVIIMNGLNNKYIYDIYSDASMTASPIVTVNGKTSSEEALPQTITESASYFIRITDDLSCKSRYTKEVRATVILLDISPSRIPIYKHEMPYSIQLNSNAVKPEFDHVGDLPAGLDLSITGLLSGTIPRSTGYEDVGFTVTVVDENGCQQFKEYMLHNCGPAPETRYDEVSYCVGSQA
jgi:hypothetical protein